MAQAIAAAIMDCEGEQLTKSEISFFKELNPYGYILFARHCNSREGIRRLTDSLREISGRDNLPILIDQEGGRVVRMKPPEWRKYPPASVFCQLADQSIEQAEKATYLNARLIAHDLEEVGVTVDCAPLADIPAEGSHDIIGDRAFGKEPQRIIQLARAQAEGLMDGGIVPVLKHIPGHGRATSDSHLQLPQVSASHDELRKSDFVPFKALNDLPMGMTAHILYSELDKNCMATQSKPIIDLIRNEIGFDGLLMTDDISMKAMEGDLGARAHASLAAGCDIVLHCNASLEEKQQAAQGVSPLSGKSLQRAEKAMLRKKPQAWDREQAIAQLDGWLAPYLA